MATETTRDVVQRAYAAYRRGDVPALTELLDPDIVYTIVGADDYLPFYGTCRGRDATLAAFGKIAALFEMHAFEVQELLADDDKAAVRTIGRFKHRESGRLVEVENADFMTVRNGRIVAFREINDTLGAHCATFGVEVAALWPSQTLTA